MRSGLSVILLLVGCASQTGPVSVDPGEGGGDGGKSDGSGTGIPDVACADQPDAGPAGTFHRVGSELVSALGDPKHRGIDLIAGASVEPQIIEGAISYTVLDKALEHEDVDLFACRAGTWRKVGTATTDHEGHFELALTGSDRLPIGLRDLFVSVVGDRTGARFLALIAPDDTRLLVSDVDGTLTTSENAFLESLALGRAPDVQAGAPAAFAAAQARGYVPVYLTARGQEFTPATRAWLDDKGFPRGPLRLSPAFLTLPGGDTVEFKTDALAAFDAAHVTVAVGVGNRATDIAAYGNAGVPGDRTFVKLPEFAGELAPEIQAGHAVGFASYDELRTQDVPALPQ